MQVMLLEVDFAGELGKLDPHPIEYEGKTITPSKLTGKAKTKALKEIQAVGAFLTQHETAKIIVSIDTHCLEENGYLVYADDNPNNLDACSLESVGVIWLLHWYGCTGAHLM